MVMKDQVGALRELVELVYVWNQEINYAVEPVLNAGIQICRQKACLLKERASQSVNAVGRALLDVVAVQPVELLHVKDRRRRCDAFKGKLFDQLLRGKGLARPAAGSPTQKGQIVHQGLGENAHVAEIGNGGCTMALGQAFTVRAKDGGEMG